MNKKNVLGIAALVIAAVFVMQMMQQDRAEARPTTQAQATQAIEYAILEVQDDDNVTFRVGGIAESQLRTESVRTTYRRLGGQDRGTFADLLNQIGSEGWNLIEKDGNLYIFSRLAT